MVATLVRLRWRLTLNALSRNIWALIGTVIATLYGLGALGLALSGAIALGQAPVDVIAQVLAAVAALTVLAWTLLPLLFTGVDSTLDPRAMAAWIAPSRSLSRALAVAAACGIPGILTALAALLPALVWAIAGQMGAALLALVLAPALLATCVLLSRVIVIGAGVSQSRRGRELAGLIGMLAVFAVAWLPSLLSNMSVGNPDGLLAALRTGAVGVGLTPVGWAAAAPGYLAQGQVLPAVALALGALIVPLALLPAWERVTRRVMTGPARASARARSYESAGQRSTGAVRALAWHARLARFMPSAAAAVAARCLRYWRSDPRYVAQAVALVFVPAILTVAFLGSRQAALSGGGTTISFGRVLSWGEAPPAVLAGAVFLALMCGWGLHNDLAFDSTALWQHVSAGLSGRNDRLGRVVAAAVWQVPLLVVVACLGGGASGRWDILPAVLGLSVAVMGCGYAWSSVTSVLVLYEMNAPGESLMKSRTSGTAFIAALVQIVGFVIIGFMTAPVVAGFAVTAVSGMWAWGWLVLAGGLLWAAGATWGGIVLGGRYLDERGPRVLTTIRSWPGHEDVR
ncbi:transporter [Actinomyces marmotae]|uniref:Transporter n=1 Tax=Actinomyces marmotae TaxID=2737173 RepID=A0A6M8B5R8_9ACTO|nr:transporter [Actinomyces marmotae]QKD79997.1 transporter [Actinomyces marmotae]